MWQGRLALATVGLQGRVGLATVFPYGLDGPPHLRNTGTVVPCGKLDRPVYILNGTGVDGIVLDLPAAPKTLTVFDAAGKPRSFEVPKSSGLVQIAVPSGGYARVE